MDSWTWGRVSGKQTSVKKFKSMDQGIDGRQGREKEEQGKELFRVRRIMSSDSSEWQITQSSMLSHPAKSLSMFFSISSLSFQLIALVKVSLET